MSYHLGYSEHVYQFRCLFFVGDTLDPLVIERDGWRYICCTWQASRIHSVRTYSIF